MTCRVIVADDHPFFLRGVEHVCATMPNIDIVATATSCDELMACLKSQEDANQPPCDVLVTDFSMPGSRQQDGLRLLSTLRRLLPSMRIIVLTMHDNAGVLGSIARMEVSGLVSKADASGELINAIQTVMEGRCYLSRTIRQTIGCEAMSRLPTKTRLSPREAEVLRLFSSGLTGNEIAATLHRSKKTISRQKVSAFHKLGVSSNVEFFVYLREMRGQAEWLSSPDRAAAESALAPLSADTLNVPAAGGMADVAETHGDLQEAAPAPAPVMRDNAGSLPVWGAATSVLR